MNLFKRLFLELLVILIAGEVDASNKDDSSSFLIPLRQDVIAMNIDDIQPHIYWDMTEVLDGFDYNQPGARISAVRLIIRACGELRKKTWSDCLDEVERARAMAAGRGWILSAVEDYIYKNREALPADYIRRLADFCNARRIIRK